MQSSRIRFTQTLIEFREDHTRTSLTMPTDLSNTERKFLHSLAGQLGLKSKSSGKGENRCITVTRMSNVKKVAGASMGGNGDADEDDSILPVLKVGRQGLDALRSYCKRHPPSAVEEAVGAKRESIRVAIYEVSPDDWSIGGEPISQLRP